MKYAFVALALAALAQAQTRDDIPSCALPCVDDAVKSSTSCAISDTPCICENFANVQAASTSCILSQCGAETAVDKVLPAVKALCANASGGSSSSAPESMTAAASTSAAASSVPVTTVPASTVPASTVPASTVPASTAVSSAPVSVPVPVGTGSSMTTAVPTASVSGGNGNGTSSTVPVQGAAAGLGSMGAFAMLVLGALAL